MLSWLALLSPRLLQVPMQGVNIRCTKCFKAAAKCALHAVNCTNKTEMAHIVSVTLRYIAVSRNDKLCLKTVHFHLSLTYHSWCRAWRVEDVGTEFFWAGSNF